MRIELRKFGEHDVLAFVENGLEWSIIVEEKTPEQMQRFLHFCADKVRSVLGSL